MLREDPLIRMRTDPTYAVNAGMMGSNDPSDQQFTEEELKLLAQLGLYDENKDAAEREMVRANKLRQGIVGGSQGSYGRWGVPTPYTGGQAFADALREGVATYRENRAEKQQAAQRRAAEQGLRLYEERERMPRTRGQMDLANSVEGARRNVDLGPTSMGDRLRSFGRRLFGG